MIPRAWLSAVLVVVCSLAVAQNQPLITVPHTDAPPTIDGQLDPAEWTNAAAVSGLVTPGGQAVAEPATVGFLMWDDQALYIAVRCVEPDADRPRGFERERDEHPWEDDAIQVFLAPEDVTRAGDAKVSFGGYADAYENWYKDIQTYYEFTVNCESSLAEARNDVRDWDADWTARAGREEGAWVAEIAVPFAAFGVEAPAGEALWGVNLLRVRQPDLSGWINPQWGGYTPVRLGAMLLARNRPFARQSAVGEVAQGANETEFELVNPTDAPAQVDVALTPTGGEAISRTIQVPAQGSETVAVPFELKGYGGLKAPYTVSVKGEDLPLLAGSLSLSLPGPYQVDVRYYATLGVVEGTLHLQPYGKATEAILTLEGADGETQTRADLTPDAGVRLRLPVTAPPGSKLSARLQGLDADGVVVIEQKAELTVFERPAWLGTEAGLPLGVLPPWTPIEVSEKSVEMLGKRLDFGDLALPSSILSAGAEMLTEPIRLTVRSGGKDIAWETRHCKVTEQTEDHVVLESRWRNDILDLRVTSTIEYDGFCWSEVRLAPRESCQVDRVALEIPLRPEIARYAYPASAQACGALSPLGLRRPISQNLWLGDEERGLGFLAESLEWVKAEDEARQVEVLPDGETTLWRSTFIDTPTILTEPYVARFALHVTPAKPISLRKSRIFHGGYYGLESAPGGGSLAFPAAGNVRLDQGTIECWVKPKFDTEEIYDPEVNRSAYNRTILSLTADAGASGNVMILYYNADDRNMRALVVDSTGGYRAILSAPETMRKDEWNYVCFSWGDALRINVNGKVREAAVTGLLEGEADNGSVHFNLSQFDLDDLRISDTARPGDTVPDAPLAADDQTLYLQAFENLDAPERVAVGLRPVKIEGDLIPGQFGSALGSKQGTQLDALAAGGKRIVIFHENWSRFQGYPDMEQIPKLKALADACHERGMLFLVYFCHMMSDAAPEWEAMQHDFMVPPGLKWYHRDDVVQDCYLSCVNGPFGDLLLDGIARLVDDAGIDGVYMDGTTVPWICSNPSHPDCGEYLGDGTYRSHMPIRGVRTFMKRLRSILAQRRKVFFLDAHTGGSINIATQSFCDGYFDGEHLSRYKPGFRMAPDVFLTGYMGKQFGFRGDFLPSRYSMDQALALSLVHDTATRGQPGEVDLALAPYEDADTNFIPYWEQPAICPVEGSPNVLCSVYVKPDRALLVLGNQVEGDAECVVDVAALLGTLPETVTASDPMKREELALSEGQIKLTVRGRDWRMIELK